MCSIIRFLYSINIITNMQSLTQGLAHSKWSTSRRSAVLVTQLHFCPLGLVLLPLNLWGWQNGLVKFPVLREGCPGK